MLTQFWTKVLKAQAVEMEVDNNRKLLTSISGPMFSYADVQKTIC